MRRIYYNEDVDLRDVIKLHESNEVWQNGWVDEEATRRKSYETDPTLVGGARRARKCVRLVSCIVYQKKKK